MASAGDSPAALIDSNVIDYAFKPVTRLLAVQILDQVADNYKVVISEYVRFELYRGLAMSKIPSLKQLLDSFVALPVDRGVLDVAAALSTCYQSDAQTKDQHKSFSDGDIIIAATAFRHQSAIITANRRDFPAPYFNEAAKYTVFDSRKRPISIYELSPDVSYLNAMLSICYPKVNA